MAALRRLRRYLRGARPEDERAEVDRHPRRSDLRLALAAARARGSLCLRGLAGEVRKRLRGGVDQGDGPRPLRSHMNSEGLERELFGCRRRSQNEIRNGWNPAGSAASCERLKSAHPRYPGTFRLTADLSIRQRHSAPASSSWDCLWER